MKHNKQVGKRGFTLIELLVVIAIISILAAILFPVFARARENARSASCLSNLKQMGLAIEMYKQDYDGKYPFARGAGSTAHWYGYLDSYVKNKQVQVCPDHSDWPIGYSYNLAFGYQPGSLFSPSRSGTSLSYCGHDVPVYDGVSDAIITNPSQSVVLLDSTLVYYRLTVDLGYSDSSAKGLADTLTPPESSDSTPDKTLTTKYNHLDAGVHNDGVNGLYADGHVKWRKLNFYFDHTIYCPVQ